MREHVERFLLSLSPSLSTDRSNTQPPPALGPGWPPYLRQPLGGEPERGLHCLRREESCERANAKLLGVREGERKSAREEERGEGLFFSDFSVLSLIFSVSPSFRYLEFLERERENKTRKLESSRERISTRSSQSHCSQSLSALFSSREDNDAPVDAPPAPPPSEGAFVDDEFGKASIFVDAHDSSSLRLRQGVRIRPGQAAREGGAVQVAAGGPPVQEVWLVEKGKLKASTFSS